MNEEDYDEAISVFESLGDFKDSKEQVVEATYQQACARLEKGYFDLAISDFEALGDYKDSKSQIPEAKYRKANSLLKKEEYDLAISAFEELGDYKDSKDQPGWVRAQQYVNALNSFESGKFSDAVSKFKALDGYKDSEEMSICAQFAEDLSDSFRKADPEKIKKLQDHETAKTLYSIYKKYLPYCGSFDCVTPGLDREDFFDSEYIVDSDFYIDENIKVHWNDHSSFLSKGPYYCYDEEWGFNGIYKKFSAIFFNTPETDLVDDMTVSNKHTGYKREESAIIEFRNNKIIYTYKENGKTNLVLEYVKKSS